MIKKGDFGLPNICPEAILNKVAYPIYPAAPVTATLLGAL